MILINQNEITGHTSRHSLTTLTNIRFNLRGNSLIIVKQASSKAFDWTKVSWQLFQKNRMPWIIATCVYFLITALFLYSKTSFLLGVFGPILMVGLLEMSRKSLASEVLEFKDLFFGFKNQFFKYLMVSLIIQAAQFLVAMLALLITLLFMGFDYVEKIQLMAIVDIKELMMFVGLFCTSLMFLLLPIIMATSFIFPLIFDQQKGYKKIIKMSWQATVINMWPLTWLGLIWIFFLIIAIIPLGLGMIFFLPFFSISYYLCFKDIFQKEGPLAELSLQPTNINPVDDPYNKDDKENDSH